VLEYQDPFDQTGNTSGTLEMTNVGLDRADNDGTIGGADTG
jgi:hypothetical protein